jgi:hypothetical protein
MDGPIGGRARRVTTRRAWNLFEAKSRLILEHALQQPSEATGFEFSPLIAGLHF